MQIFVAAAFGKKNAYSVTPDMSIGELSDTVKEREGLENAYLVYGPHVLRDEDREKTLKTLNIQNNTTLQIIVRMVGGTPVDADILFSIIAMELETCIQTLPFAKTPLDGCSICLDADVPVTRVCHQYYCATCFLSGLKSENFKLKCVNCQVTTSAGELIPALKPTVDEMRTTQALLCHVDVQMCRCGTIMFNETLKPWAVCELCRHEFCFFCKSTWNRATMTRQHVYRCSDTCPFHLQFAFEPVPWGMGAAKDAKIPNLRLCPKCGVRGGYDMKCKYHRCTCGFTFCFLCLKSQRDCEAAGSGWNQTCTTVVQGGHTMPHLIARPIAPPKK